MNLTHNWPDDVYSTIDDYRGLIPEDALTDIVEGCEPMEVDEEYADDVVDEFCEEITNTCDRWITEHEEEPAMIIDTGDKYAAAIMLL